MTPEPAEPVAAAPCPTRLSESELRQILDRHRAWVETGGRDGCRANLSGRDLAAADLEGANLAGAKLIGARLTGANLIGADLSGAHLTSADLCRAELNLANLVNARLTDARLGKAELHHANLSGAYLERADLTGANLRHADLHHADLQKVVLVGADLHRCNLSHAHLSQAKLTQIDLSKANLRHADLGHADLSQANLIDADLSSARLTRARLYRANLTGADLNGAQLVWANLTRAKLKATKLANADLRSARVTRLDQTFVRGAQFSSLSGRWWAFLCDIVFGPLSRWLHRRGWHRAARQVGFTANHNDPWSILRESYAGPRVLFLFFVVIVFVLPYAIKAAVYSAAGPVEREAESVLQYHRQQLEARRDSRPNDPYTREELAQINHILSRLERKPVWKVLLRWDTGRFWPTLLAGLLIVYNVGLYILIGQVSSLRDEEERSGWAPAWRDYGHLLWIHRLVIILFYVSFGSFLINIGQILTEETLIPRLR